MKLPHKCFSLELEPGLITSRLLFLIAFLSITNQLGICKYACGPKKLFLLLVCAQHPRGISCFRNPMTNVKEATSDIATNPEAVRFPQNEVYRVVLTGGPCAGKPWNPLLFILSQALPLAILISHSDCQSNTENMHVHLFQKMKARPLH